MDQPRIIFDKVSKVFMTRRKRIEALRDICFEIHDHEFVSFIGPSGCGKSTIIRLMDDIIKPTSGRITVDGFTYDNSAPVPKVVIRKLGFVFQTPNLLPWLTVKDNILFPMRILKDRKRDWDKVADELLQMAGMQEYANAYPRALSGGMLQRVGVLRAMSYQPEILLMDEPYGALDEIMRQSLDMETMKLWEKLGQTIVFITHNVAEAVFVSDRVFVMGTDPGRIMEEIKIDLPRPRSLDLTATLEFVAYKELLTQKIGRIDLSQVK